MQLSRPTTVDEALRLLSDHGEDCTVIAGGTAIMLMMRSGLADPVQR